MVRKNIIKMPNKELNDVIKLSRARGIEVMGAKCKKCGKRLTIYGECINCN